MFDDAPTPAILHERIVKYTSLCRAARDEGKDVSQALAHLARASEDLRSGETWLAECQTTSAIEALAAAFAAPGSFRWGFSAFESEGWKAFRDKYWR